MVVGAQGDGESAAWAKDVGRSPKERSVRAEAERAEDGRAYVCCRGRQAGEDGGGVSEDEGKVAEFPVLGTGAADLNGVAVDADADADSVIYADKVREVVA